jgi:hypothetical protein
MWCESGMMDAQESVWKAERRLRQFNYILFGIIVLFVAAASFTSPERPPQPANAAHASR